MIICEHDTYLCSEECCGTNPYPAVKGIEVVDVICVVIIEHCTKTGNRHDERKKQKPSM